MPFKKAYFNDFKYADFTNFATELNSVWNILPQHKSDIKLSLKKIQVYGKTQNQSKFKQVVTSLSTKEWV